MRLRKRFVGFILVIQTLLFLAHYFLYQTWSFRNSAAQGLWLALILGLLSISFVSASMLAFSYTNPLVRAFYRASAIWMGFLSFLVLAGALAWIVFALAAIAEVILNFHLLVEILFALGFGVALLALFNAHWTRITRIRIELANLPDAWRGRKAALVSDVHLGHVRNGDFLRRLITKILQEEPDAVFIAGDLYDGTAIDAARAAAPLSELTAPHGVYFVAGNHEQFGDDTKYLNAIKAAGVRILHNQKVDVDGLQIIGVPYRNAGRGSLDRILHSLHLDRQRASILLLHAPDHPEVAEAAGISLQLSGHTHLGQFIPWSWMARRIYRQFVYGLSRIGRMQVFTSSGVGTWGPPLRLGSNPEIVVLEFI
jgi:predicted MPP superfamily phosphohydrolase